MKRRPLRFKVAVEAIVERNRALLSVYACGDLMTEFLNTDCIDDSDLIVAQAQEREGNVALAAAAIEYLLFIVGSERRAELEKAQSVVRSRKVFDE